MLEKIRPLTQIPHIIIVGEGTDRFHIVHAELTKLVPASYSYQILTDQTVDEWAKGKGEIPDPSSFTWNRGIFGEYSSLDGKPETFPGLSPTYCGHTPGTKEGSKATSTWILAQDIREPEG